jgi:hypothetical protein
MSSTADLDQESCRRNRRPRRTDRRRSLRRLRGGWPTTVPAIAGGIGVLLALSDGGIEAAAARSFDRRNRRRRLPGPTGGFGFGLPRIEFRLLALAVERVVAGIGCAAGGGQAVGRDLPIRDGAGLCACRLSLQLGSLSGSFVSPRSGAAANPAATSPSRTGLNRSGVTVWACARVPIRAISARHGKARVRRARAAAAPCWTRHHDKNTPTKTAYRRFHARSERRGKRR